MLKALVQNILLKYFLLSCSICLLFLFSYFKVDNRVSSTCIYGQQFVLSFLYSLGGEDAPA